jgi:hypothetical protein
LNPELLDVELGMVELLDVVEEDVLLAEDRYSAAPAAPIIITTAMTNALARETALLFATIKCVR